MTKQMDVTAKAQLERLQVEVDGTVAATTTTTTTEGVAAAATTASSGSTREILGYVVAILALLVVFWVETIED